MTGLYSVTRYVPSPESCTNVLPSFNELHSELVNTLLNRIYVVEVILFCCEEGMGRNFDAEGGEVDTKGKTRHPLLLGSRAV